MPHPILVTGGAGYIGSHTCKQLAYLGYTPITFDNLSTGHKEAVQWGPLVVGDLSDSDLLKRTMQTYRIESVIHFAASAYVGESIVNPQKYFHNNVKNSLLLLDAIVAMEIPRLVFSSTCAVYGIPEKGRIQESTPKHPINPYGESKYFIEKMLHWYGEAYGLSSMALRYFNAAGADPDGEIGECHDPEPHLIPRLIAAADRRLDHISVNGTDYPTPDGTAVRDYIHVNDLAMGHIRAIDYLEKGGKSDVCNLGTGHGVSILSLLAAVEQHSGKKVPWFAGPRRPGDPPSLVADPSYAKELLGFEATNSSLEQIISTALQWSRRNEKMPKKTKEVAV